MVLKMVRYGSGRPGKSPHGGTEAGMQEDESKKEEALTISLSVRVHIHETVCPWTH